MTNRQRALALLSAFVVAAIVAAFLYARATGHADREVTARTISLRQCLVGSGIGQGHTYRSWLLQLELGQSPQDDPAERDAPWPLRCEPEAGRLARALQNGPPGYVRGPRARLLTLTEALFAPSEQAERPVLALAKRLEAWEAEIVSAGLPSADRDAEPEPGAASAHLPALSGPLPMLPIRVGEATQYAHDGALLLGPEPLRHVTLVSTETQSARVFRLAGNALSPFTADGDASTLFLPRTSPAGLSLLDARGNTVWPGPGEVFAHGSNPGGTYLACDDKHGCRAFSVVRRGDDYPIRGELALPRDQIHALVNGVVVSRSRNEDPEPLFVAPPDAPLAARVALSPALEPWLRLRACRAHRHTVLAVQGPARTTFFFHDGATWSEGQAAQSPDLDSLGGAQVHLGCDEEGASIVSREDDKLALLRCTPRACERSVTRSLPDGRALAFAPVGDKIFTARVVEGNGDYRAARSVWVRFGSPEGLHIVESLLLGDDEHGGHAIGRVSALPAGTGALLAMTAAGTATEGTYVVLIDRAGRPQVVQTAPETGAR